MKQDIPHRSRKTVLCFESLEGAGPVKAVVHLSPSKRGIAIIDIPIHIEDVQIEYN